MVGQHHRQPAEVGDIRVMQAVRAEQSPALLHPLGDPGDRGTPGLAGVG